MKTLKNIVCGLGLLALVGSPVVLADEHPAGEHPGTEAGAAAPTPDTVAGGVTETRGAGKTTKTGKRVTKRIKRTKKTETTEILEPESKTPAGN